MDDARAPPASASETASGAYGRQFTESFIEAHRKKIFLGLSVAGTLLLGPFAVNNFFQDRVLIGVISCAFVVCLVLNAWAIFRGRDPLVPATAIFFGSLVGLTTAMYNNGLIGILWVYPAILLFHFMLPRRTANVFNLTLLAVAFPMAWLRLGPEMAARVGVTLGLLIVFSNIFSYIADVQQRKEAEQRERLDALVRQLEQQNSALREAFRMREEVERIARHDLRTPLASIASVPRLLRARRPLEPGEDELVGMVERAALRVLSMVNLSLDLYRMEEGSYRPRPQAVDLGAVVQTVARELQAHAASKNLRLVLDLPPQPVHALGEELLCYSTIANLLKNALEASPDDAEVRVTLRSADEVVLAIHNLGEVPEVMRDSFFAKYATHGKPGGHGLGAYSAQLMTRVQNGRLSMESGQGHTVLTLCLPTCEAPAAARAPGIALPTEAGAEAPPLPPLSVLLVDDDEYNIVVLKSLLPSPPLSVRTAVNGRAALERVREARPDVIFLDVEMPVMGGIEALQAIRALQAERGEVPSLVTAFTAHDDAATRQRCLDLGFDLYLSKPASREEVMAVLRGRQPAPAPPAAAAIEPALLPLLPQFLASRLQLARKLAEAAQQGERETLRTTAHQLAGSLAMYGFAEASRASIELERAAPAGDLQDLRRRSEALAELLAQALPPAQG